MSTDVRVLVVCDEHDPHGTAVLARLVESGVPSLRYNLGDVVSYPLEVRDRVVEIDAGDDRYRINDATTVWWRGVGSVDTTGLAPDDARLVTDEGPALLVGLLDRAGVRWVDDPAFVTRAELKLRQLAVASGLGIMVPRHVVTNVPEAAQQFASDGPVVAKAMSAGVGIAPFVNEATTEDLVHVAAFPTLLQELVTSAVADLRVVVVGREAWVWRRERLGAIDWRQADPAGLGFVPTENAPVCSAALRVTAALHLTMSVQDWLETPSHPVFLESNAQGAWLFLAGAEAVVVPSLARHLSGRDENIDVAGVWPKAVKRFALDFLSADRAPPDDGAIAPRFATPLWVGEAAASEHAIDVARRSHDDAREGAMRAEEKAGRLSQTSLALLTLIVAVGGFQAKFVFDRSWLWSVTLLPVASAMVFMAIAAFESIQVDRVGFYGGSNASALTRTQGNDPVASIIAAEEDGRRLASWTSQHKHTDLMQARAWFTRGLAALIVAGLVAVVCRAGEDSTSTDVPVRESPPTLTT